MKTSCTYANAFRLHTYDAQRQGSYELQVDGVWGAEAGEDPRHTEHMLSI